MGRVVAIGDRPDLAGLGLVGVSVVRDPSTEAVERAWRALGDDVGLVILSPSAAAALQPFLSERPDVLTAVLP